MFSTIKKQIKFKNKNEVFNYVFDPILRSIAHGKLLNSIFRKRQMPKRRVKTGIRKANILVLQRGNNKNQGRKAKTNSNKNMSKSKTEKNTTKRQLKLQNDNISNKVNK